VNISGIVRIDRQSDLSAVISFAAMSRTLVRAFPLILYSISAAAAQSGDWEFVGPQGFSPGPAQSGHIAFDSDNTPYVAYKDESVAGARASVQRFAMGGWEFVGEQGGASIGSAWYADQSIDAQGNVYVATRDYQTAGRINVRHHAAGGGPWASVGVEGISAGEAHYTTIALRSDGVPFVAFADRSTTPIDRATVMTYQAGAWAVVGEAGASPNTANYLRLAIAPDGTLYLGFSDQDHRDTYGYGKASVMRFDGSSNTWSYVGQPGYSAHGAHNMTIAVDKAGGVWSAHHHYHEKIVVHRFDGAQWVEVGGSASGTDLPDVQTENWRQWLSLSFDSQRQPYVAYQLLEHGLKAAVRRFDGSSWVPVGSLAFSPGAAHYLALAIDGNDVPYVVFRDEAHGFAASVMRYAPSPHTYCTAKVNSQGCVSSIAGSGQASLSSGNPCVISASNVLNQHTGMLLIGVGPLQYPFLGGTLCIAPPIRRTQPQDSGGTQGTLDCSGSYSLDINPLLQSGYFGAIQPGQLIFAQFWSRDLQASHGIGLTDGLRVTVGP
jgi:hypothetical protein